jgi:SAM-dependent methyltransferase
VTQSSTLPPGVELELAACALGCPPGPDQEVVCGRDRLHDIPGEFTVFKCWRCGLLRTSPRPTQETIGIYYPSSYGPHAKPPTADRQPGQSQPVKRALAHRIASLMNMPTAYLPPIRPGTLLEVGCGSGSFLSDMARTGWSVEGVEASEHAASIARAAGHRVRTGALETVELPTAAFDLAVGWMVVEHLHHPVDALRNLSHAVRSGGWLAVSLPNAACAQFRIFRSRWYGLQLPTHLFHYTPRSLNRVMSAAGWSMQRVFHQRVLSDVFGSLGHVLSDLRMMPELSRRLVDCPSHPGNMNAMLYPLATVLAAVGQTARMTVWARKL